MKMIVSRLPIVPPAAPPPGTSQTTTRERDDDEDVADVRAAVRAHGRQR